jgi:hypothetical protein
MLDPMIFFFRSFSFLGRLEKKKAEAGPLSPAPGGLKEYFPLENKKHSSDHHLN